MSRAPKILLYDIETSLMRIYTFSLYGSYNTHDDIIEDWKILSIAYKWHGQKRVSALHGDEHKMLGKFAEVLNEADIIIGHNADRFDLRRIKTRMLWHGLPPIKRFNSNNSIDTYKVAKREFNFSSNRLDYLGQYLGVGEKIHVNKDLWRRAALGQRAAIREMVAYNKQDVLLLENVYDKLRPYISNHPNMALINGSDHACPNCGGKELQRNGTRRTRSGIYQRWLCNYCGAYSQGGQALKRTELR